MRKNQPWTQYQDQTVMKVFFFNVPKTNTYKIWKKEEETPYFHLA